MSVLMDFRVNAKAEFDFSVVKLKFERAAWDLVRVTTFDAEGNVESLSAGVEEGDLISFRPIPPAGFKVSTDKLMVKLPEAYVFLPKRSASLVLRFPADLGVFAGGSQILRVPLSRIKYALYGPSDLGTLCRYFGTDILESSYPEALGFVKLNVTNSYKDPVSVGKIVVPAEGLGIYVTEGNEIVFSSVDISIVDPGYAEVSANAKPSLGHANFKYSMRGHAVKYSMHYGLV